MRSIERTSCAAIPHLANHGSFFSICSSNSSCSALGFQRASLSSVASATWQESLLFYQNQLQCPVPQFRTRVHAADSTLHSLHRLSLTNAHPKIGSMACFILRTLHARAPKHGNRIPQKTVFDALRLLISQGVCDLDEEISCFSDLRQGVFSDVPSKWKLATLFLTTYGSSGSLPSTVKSLYCYELQSYDWLSRVGKLSVQDNVLPSVLDILSEGNKIHYPTTSMHDEFLKMMRTFLDHVSSRKSNLNDVNALAAPGTSLTLLCFFLHSALACLSFSKPSDSQEGLPLLSDTNCLRANKSLSDSRTDVSEHISKNVLQVLQSLNVIIQTDSPLKGQHQKAYGAHYTVLDNLLRTPSRDFTKTSLCDKRGKTILFLNALLHFFLCWVPQNTALETLHSFFLRQDPPSQTCASSSAAHGSFKDPNKDSFVFPLYSKCTYTSQLLEFYASHQKFELHEQLMARIIPFPTQQEIQTVLSKNIVSSISSDAHSPASFLPSSAWDLQQRNGALDSNAAESYRSFRLALSSASLSEMTQNLTVRKASRRERYRSLCKVYRKILRAGSKGKKVISSCSPPPVLSSVKNLISLLSPRIPFSSFSKHSEAFFALLRFSHTHKMSSTQTKTLLHLLRRRLPEGTPVLKTLGDASSVFTHSFVSESFLPHYSHHQNQILLQTLANEGKWDSLLQLWPHLSTTHPENRHKLLYCFRNAIVSTTQTINRVKLWQQALQFVSSQDFADQNVASEVLLLLSLSPGKASWSNVLYGYARAQASGKQTNAEATLESSLNASHVLHALCSVVEKYSYGKETREVKFSSVKQAQKCDLQKNTNADLWSLALQCYQTSSFHKFFTANHVLRVLVHSSPRSCWKTALSLLCQEPRVFSHHLHRSLWCRIWASLPSSAFLRNDKAKNTTSGVVWDILEKLPSTTFPDLFWSLALTTFRRCDLMRSENTELKRFASDSIMQGDALIKTNPGLQQACLSSTYFTEIMEHLSRRSILPNKSLRELFRRYHRRSQVYSSLITHKGGSGKNAFQTDDVAWLNVPLITERENKSLSTSDISSDIPLNSSTSSTRSRREVLSELRSPILLFSDQCWALGWCPPECNTIENILQNLQKLNSRPFSPSNALKTGKSEKEEISGETDSESKLELSHSHRWVSSSDLYCEASSQSAPCYVFFRRVNPLRSASGPIRPEADSSTPRKGFSNNTNQKCLPIRTKTKNTLRSKLIDASNVSASDFPTGICTWRYFVLATLSSLSFDVTNVSTTSEALWKSSPFLSALTSETNNSEDALYWDVDLNNQTIYQGKLPQSNAWLDAKHRTFSKWVPFPQFLDFVASITSYPPSSRYARVSLLKQMPTVSNPHISPHFLSKFGTDSPFSISPENKSNSVKTNPASSPRIVSNSVFAIQITTRHDTQHYPVESTVLHEHTLRHSVLKPLGLKLFGEQPEIGQDDLFLLSGKPSDRQKEMGKKTLLAIPKEGVSWCPLEIRLGPYFVESTPPRDIYEWYRSQNMGG